MFWGRDAKLPRCGRKKGFVNWCTQVITGPGNRLLDAVDSCLEVRLRVWPTAKVFSGINVSERSGRSKELVSWINDRNLLFDLYISLIS